MQQNDPPADISRPKPTNQLTTTTAAVAAAPSVGPTTTAAATPTPTHATAPPFCYAYSVSLPHTPNVVCQPLAASVLGFNPCTPSPSTQMLEFMGGSDSASARIC